MAQGASLFRLLNLVTGKRTIHSLSTVTSFNIVHAMYPCIRFLASLVVILIDFHLYATLSTPSGVAHQMGYILLKCIIDNPQNTAILIILGGILLFVHIGSWNSGILGVFIV